MPFEFFKDRIRKIVNLETGAVLTIDGTPEFDRFRCSYLSGERLYVLNLVSNIPPADATTSGINDKIPSICITVSSLTGAFGAQSDLNAAQIQSRLAEIVIMIGVATSRDRISRNSCAWSDFEFYAHKDPKVAAHLQGYVPKNIELMRLSCPDH